MACPANTRENLAGQLKRTPNPVHRSRNALAELTSPMSRTTVCPGLCSNFENHDPTAKPPYTRRGWTSAAPAEGVRRNMERNIGPAAPSREAWAHPWSPALVTQYSRLSYTQRLVG